jgi:hypothetical protein
MVCRGRKTPSTLPVNIAITVSSRPMGITFTLDQSTPWSLEPLLEDGVLDGAHRKGTDDLAFK